MFVKSSVHCVQYVEKSENRVYLTCEMSPYLTKLRNDRECLAAVFNFGSGLGGLPTPPCLKEDAEGTSGSDRSGCEADLDKGTKDFPV